VLRARRCEGGVQKKERSYVAESSGVDGRPVSAHSLSSHVSVGLLLRTREHAIQAPVWRGWSKRMRVAQKGGKRAAVSKCPSDKRRWAMGGTRRVSATYMRLVRSGARAAAARRALSHLWTPNKRACELSQSVGSASCLGAAHRSIIDSVVYCSCESHLVGQILARKKVADAAAHCTPTTGVSSAGVARLAPWAGGGRSPQRLSLAGTQRARRGRPSRRASPAMSRRRANERTAHFWRLDLCAIHTGSWPFIL